MLKKAAFLRLSNDVYRGEVLVLVVGEDGDRYKIETDRRICIDGKRLFLDPGQTRYVLKSSVVMVRDMER